MRVESDTFGSVYGDEESDSFDGAGVGDAVGDIGCVVSGIAGSEGDEGVAGFDGDFTFVNGDEFASAGEVGCAGHAVTRLHFQFVELDVFFEVERVERADAHFVIIDEVVSFVISADDVDLLGLSGVVHKFAEGNAEGLGNTVCDIKGWIDGLAFDLADHGAADTGFGGELVERPAF